MVACTIVISDRSGVRGPPGDEPRDEPTPDDESVDAQGRVAQGAAVPAGGDEVDRVGYN